MKKIIPLLICCLVCLCGCRATPEAETVHRRKEEQYTAEAAACAENQKILSEIPKHIAEEWTEYGGKLKLEIDADVEIPNCATWKIYRTKLHDFTVEEAEALCDALMGLENLYEVDHRMTKREYLEEIRDYREAIEKIQNGEADLNGNTIEDYEQMIEYDEKKIADAPNEAAETPFAFDRAREPLCWIDIFAKKGIEANPHFDISNSDGYGGYFVFHDCGFSQNAENKRLSGTYVNVFSFDDYRISIQKSRSQAVEEATAFLQKMGLQENFAFEGTVEMYGTGYEGGTWDVGAYGIVFTRLFQGIPRAYLENDDVVVESGDSEERGGAYTVSVENENLVIVVDDSGPVQVEWTAPDEVIGVENENVALQPFCEITGAYRGMLKYRYAYVGDAEELLSPQDFAAIEPTVVKIKKIKLSYVKINIPYNYKEFRVVPAWVLYDETDAAILAVNATDMSVIA